LLCLAALRLGKKEYDMNPWPKHPVIYEINSRVWLHELSGQYGRSIELASVPGRG
jgi:hypothetical protein